MDETAPHLQRKFENHCLRLREDDLTLTPFYEELSVTYIETTVHYVLLGQLVKTNSAELI
jgi:hypothetical protein